MLADALKRQCRGAFDLVKDRLSDRDGTGIGQGLHPGGNVDAVAEKIIAINHGIGQVDSHTQLEAVVSVLAYCAKHALDLVACLDGIDRARKFAKEAVACPREQPPAMAGDQFRH